MVFAGSEIPGRPSVGPPPGSGLPGTWPPAAGTPEGGIRRGRRPGAYRVLLVEDEPADAELVYEALGGARHHKFEVERVVRLADAERAVREDPPELILLDLGLPDARGLISLDRMLAAAGDVPVVVLTGSDDDRTAARAVQRGAQDYLHKQMLLDPELLVRSLLHSLERHRLLWEARRQSGYARRAVRELQRLVQSNADGMVVVDPGGIVLFANRAAEELFGERVDDLVGSPPPLPAEWTELGELEVTGADGTRRAVELRVAELEWNGSPARLVSLRDITERRAAEELRQRLLHADRLRSIGQLAAGVAHEINNPAAYVTVNQEILSDRLRRLGDAIDRVRGPAAGLDEPSSRRVNALLDELDVDGLLAEVRETVDENRHGMERVIAIVRSLRSFSRVEQGHVEETRLDDVVHDASLIVQNQIRHRAALIEELGDPPPIVADRGRLTQVVVNLLVNAAQAIEEGHHDRNRITVRTGREGDRVRIEVEDTGCGIDEAARERIFEPFFTTKGRDQGTGLGLALSGEIARQHGGEIRVRSEVGQGTTFEIVLPVHTGLTPSPTSSAAPATDVEAGSEPFRFLVIDDEPALLRGLRRMLGRKHKIITAGGGEEGLRVLETDRAFDIILCDLMMPEVDGPRVHAWVERNAPELLDRMVYMSGGAFTDRTRAFTSREDVRVVDKPLSKRTIEALVIELG